MYHSLLVIGHFAIAAVLVLSVDWWPMNWGRLLVGLPGVLLAVWAWRSVGLRRLRVQPTTVESTQLIQSGPYAIVRHPMYTGLLWFTAAILLFHFTWWRATLLLVLLINLLLKTIEEERSLRSRFPEYTAYQAKVRRLLPLRK